MVYTIHADLSCNSPAHEHIRVNTAKFLDVLDNVGRVIHRIPEIVQHSFKELSEYRVPVGWVDTKAIATSKGKNTRFRAYPDWKLGHGGVLVVIVNPVRIECNGNAPLLTRSSNGIKPYFSKIS